MCTIQCILNALLLGHNKSLKHKFVTTNTFNCYDTIAFKSKIRKPSRKNLSIKDICLPHAWKVTVLNMGSNITHSCFCVSDYDPDCMARVLELITTGVTILDTAAQHVYEGMIFILDSLQINIKLGEIWSNAPTTNLKSQKAWTSDHDSSSFHNSSQNERRKSYR